MKVKIRFNDGQIAVVHNRVLNAFQEANMYVIFTGTEFYKYPLCRIYDVREEYIKHGELK